MNSVASPSITHVVEAAPRDMSEVRAWLFVALLTTAYVFSMLDRTIIALLIQPIQKDLQISDTQFGLLLGPAFAVFYFVAGIPIGWLVDRTNRVRLVAGAIALWSAATILSGFATRFTLLFLARIGVGVGEAVLNPTTYSLLPDLFAKDRLGRALAIYLSGSMLGTGLAFLLGGQLLTLLSAYPAMTLPLVGIMRDWQVALVLVGAPGLLLALCMVVMREPRRRVHAADPSDNRAVLDFLKRRRVVFFLLVASFSGVTILASAFMSWVPALMFRTHGMSQHQTGIAMAVATGVFGILGFLLGGLLADYWLRRGHVDAHMKVGFWAMIAALPMAWLVCFSSNDLAAIAGLCGLMFLLTAPNPAGVAGLQLITPPLLRGRVSAVYMIVLNLIGFGVGPILVGFLTDHAFGSKSALNLSLAVVAGTAIPITIVTFGLGRGRLGACIAEIMRAKGHNGVI